MMKHTFLTLIVTCALVIQLNAQTPFDSFAPEATRPMLEIEESTNTTSDSILYTIVADMQSQMLLLVDVSTAKIVATMPITDDIRKWLSVDPLADKYIYISPYAYCSWNPINKIDPDGREEWELDVNTGKFQNIGDKGGSTTDYYHVGTYDGDKFSSYSDFTIERGDGAINSFRIQETDKSTISAFHIPETNTAGYILERPGPDTEESGQSLRIPAGQYCLRENPYSSFPGVPRLYLQNEGKEGAFDKRGILIHVGNYPKDSKGCLLPGSSYATDFVGNSGNTLKNIIKYVKNTGWNCKLNIYNAFK